MNKVKVLFENNKILYSFKSILKLIIKSIIYIGYQLIFHWKFSILLLTSSGILIFNKYYKEITHSFFNNDFIKSITFNRFYNNIYVPLYVIELFVITLLSIWLIKENTIKDCKSDELSKVIGLKNGNKQPPYIAKLGIMWSNLKLRYMILNANGTTIDMFNDPQTRKSFETALNINIVDIIPVKHSKKLIKTIYTSPRCRIPDKIDWNNKYINDDNFIISLGQNISGQIKINLTKTPHQLIGGITNSGKSVLIENIGYQCARKNAIVRFGDLKGTDYLDWDKIDIDAYNVINNKDFKYQCKVSNNLEEIKNELALIDDEYIERKILFNNKRIKNIIEYNKYAIKNNLKPLSRIIFIFDEVAMLQSNKDNKSLVNDIEYYLMKFATQGRAFGVHLILSTQRPDSDLLKGQIRSNLDVRICGRTAERGLSEIVLGKGNYDADQLIGKDEIGMFVMNNGKMFRGYYFDSENILKQYHNEEQKL